MNHHANLLARELEARIKEDEAERRANVRFWQRIRVRMDEIDAELDELEDWANTHVARWLT